VNTPIKKFFYVAVTYYFDVCTYLWIKKHFEFYKERLSSLNFTRERCTQSIRLFYIY